MDQLIAKLKKLEKQNYRAYQSLKGEYAFNDFQLYIDYIQGDPYASASRLRAVRAWSLTGLSWLQQESEPYQIAARDFIARSFAQYAKQDNHINIALTGQTVLDSTAVLFTEQGIELRFRVDLPAEGRSILAKKALNILTFHLPKIIRKSTLERELDKQALIIHCQVIEDQTLLREQLEQHNLTAFIGNGSLLPRMAGNSDLPMKEAIKFQAPPTLEVELTTKYQGKIKGLGIPNGVTVIVGGGFHGKSTLLTAIERSIYNHIPGDGREHIVTNADAMKIRAEDGRCVHSLNLSNYINHLPQNRDTRNFSTQDASGSTSQAAWIQESVEAEVPLLLIDEDTSATNFMIRDERMQMLVSSGEEPITPFVDRVGELRDQLKISTILVMGGSGDYLDVADTVIQMHEYQAIDVSERAREVVEKHPTQRVKEGNNTLLKISPRRLNQDTLIKILADGKFRVSAKGMDCLRLGKEFIDLSALSQLESTSQINAIGWICLQLGQRINTTNTAGWLNKPIAEINKSLADNWNQTMPLNGDIAKPRAIDVLAVLNRMRKANFRSQD